MFCTDLQRPATAVVFTVWTRLANGGPHAKRYAQNHTGDVQLEPAFRALPPSLAYERTLDIRDRRAGSSAVYAHALASGARHSFVDRRVWLRRSFSIAGSNACTPASVGRSVVFRSRLFQLSGQAIFVDPVPMMALAATIAFNAPPFEASWREQIAFLSRVTDEVRHNTFDPVSMRRLYEHEWRPPLGCGRLSLVRLR